MQIWALRDKVLRDDPNESSTVYLLTSDNKHAVCWTDFSPMQISFFAENISHDSSLWRRLSIMCQARKMIKFHWCSFRNIKVKQIGQICSLITHFFFFVIPKVCWTVCVFHFLNLESLKRIYTSLFTFKDFRHHCVMILKTNTQKLRKGTLQRVNAFFTKLLSEMWTSTY